MICSQLVRVKTPVKFLTRSGSQSQVPIIVARNWPTPAMSVTKCKEMDNGFASHPDSGLDLSPHVCQFKVFIKQTLVDISIELLKEITLFPTIEYVYIYQQNWIYVKKKRSIHYYTQIIEKISIIFDLLDVKIKSQMCSNVLIYSFKKKISFNFWIHGRYNF